MKTHCIYGSDDCTRCKPCELENNKGVCDRQDCSNNTSCRVAPEDGLRRDTLREDFILLLDEFMVFLETEEGKDYAANFVCFMRWINK
jgi:hypothetical protein